jgi:hypothetical protein
MRLILEVRVDKLISPTAGRDRPHLPARGRKLIASAVATAALLVAVPGAAAAQASSPTSAQYQGQVQLAQQQIHQAGTASPDNRVIGALPFTGVDLVLLGVMGLVLVGAGGTLQRLSVAAESDRPGGSRPERR